MNKENKIFEMHAQLCKTLAHPKRLEIISFLKNGEKSVKELLDRVGISKANLSQHLAILRQNNVILARRNGLNIYYSISNKKMIQACDIIREVLFEQFEDSHTLLKKYKKSK